MPAREKRSPVGEGPLDDRDDDGAADKDGGLVPLSKEEIEEGNIMEMAQDKVKSRLLQRALLRGSPDVCTLVYSKAEPHFMELVHDHYGNYLSQKILEVATPEQFDGMFILLKDKLISLAQDVHGTRAVQKVVEQAIARNKIPELVEALPVAVVEDLSRSVTGFHVVSKLIELLPTAEVEAYIGQLCGTPEQALEIGKDQWGCCVMKKCIDRSEGPLHDRIVKTITDNALTLVQDAFGNYVVQHLILSSKTKPNPQVSSIIDALKGRMFELSLLKFSSNVLEKCLVNSSDKDRNKIINEILNPPDHLPSEAVQMLIFHQYGNYVFQQALDGAKDPQFSLLVEHSKQLVQDIALEKEPRAQEPGNLPAEHAKRLAVKLMKKYAGYSEGLDAVVPDATAMVDPWNQFGFDPYSFDLWGGMPGVYGGYPQMGWDASAFGMGLPFGYPLPKGAKGGRGGGAAKSHGKRQKPSTAKAGAGADGTSPSGEPVGRIVGFWPNYSVSYDEAPSAAAGGGRPGGGGRSKSKAKAKAK